MDQKNLQIVYNRLLEIKEGIKICKNIGICDNLKYRYDNNNYKPIIIQWSILISWLKKQFQAWPECHKFKNGTKNLAFPVGGSLEFNSSTITNPKRLKLLDYLIEQASKQLNEMTKEQ